MVRLAQAEATRLREAGKAEAEAATTAATNEALAIVARAEESAVADRRRGARRPPPTIATEADERARGVLEDARATADGVRSEGLELVSNLREMGNSLRGNAERLLGDVQRVHSSLVAQIARVERATGVPDRASGREVGAVAAGAGESVGDGGGRSHPSATTGSTCRSSSRRAELAASAFLLQSVGFPSEPYANIRS